MTISEFLSQTKNKLFWIKYYKLFNISILKNIYSNCSLIPVVTDLTSKCLTFYTTKLNKEFYILSSQII